MQICFSIASKASTTVHPTQMLTDSSFAMIANMEHGYDPAKGHHPNFNKDLKVAPPSELAS